MKTFLLGAALLVTAQISFAFDDPDNFRGIEWGASPDQARQAGREQWTKSLSLGSAKPYPTDEPLSGQGTLRWFTYRDKVADEDVEIRLNFLDEKFVNAELMFKSTSFVTLERAFKERYGEPTAEQVAEMQNERGEKSENIVLTWTGKDVQIRLSKHFGSLTEGKASIGQRAYTEYVLKHVKQNSSAPAQKKSGQ